MSPERDVGGWSSVDAENIWSTDEGGAPENMNRSTVNNSARARMGALRRWYDDPEWLALTGSATVSKLNDTTLRVSSLDATSWAVAGRKIKIQTAGTPPTNVLETFIVSSSFSTHTDIVITPTDVIHVAVDELLFYFSASIRSLAFESTVVDLDYYIPAALTDVALQASIDAAAAAGGGVVLLSRGTYLLNAAVNLKSLVSLVGRGRNATIIKMDDSKNLAACLKGADISKFVLEGFSIDGNRAENGSGAGHGIHIDAASADCNQFRIQNILVEDTLGTGIRLTGSVSSITGAVITGCDVITPGTDGFVVTSESDAVTRVRISDCSNYAPGLDGTTANVAGFRVAGQFSMSNCDSRGLNQAGAQVSRGFVLTALAAAEPNGESALYSSLSGFHVEGGAASARGVEIGGFSCSVTGGQIALSGAAATGVIFDAATPGQSTYSNVVSGVTIRAADTGFNIPADADSNDISGCVIHNATTAGISIAGDKNLVSGVRIVTCGIGVQLAATADSNSVSSCLITGITGTGVDFVASSTDNFVSGCKFLGTGVTGVSDAGTNNTISRNDYSGLSGGTARSITGTTPTVDELGTHIVYKPFAVQAFAGVAGVVALTGMEGIKYPAGGANGSRRYLVRTIYTFSNNSFASIATWQIHSGGSDTVASDPVVLTQALNPVVSLTSYFDSGALLIQPAAADTLSLSINKTGGGTTTIVASHSASEVIENFVSFDPSSCLRIEYLDG